jgi:predicted dehydrogenase
VRFHPQWLKVRELVRGGRIGDPRAVQVLFSYFNVDSENIRNMADIGGGALYDIGCYPIVVARYIFAAEPVRVMGLIDRDPAFRTDRLTSGLIDFGEGRHLTFTVSTQLTPYQRVNILGTKARLAVEIPFNAPQGEAVNLYLDNGRKLADASARRIRIAKVDQYRLQAEAFGRAVRGEEPLEFGVDDAILQARVLDAVFRSAKSGRWETP